MMGQAIVVLGPADPALVVCELRAPMVESRRAIVCAAHMRVPEIIQHYLLKNSNSEIALTRQCKSARVCPTGAWGARPCSSWTGSLLLRHDEKDGNGHD